MVIVKVIFLSTETYGLVKLSMCAAVCKIEVLAQLMTIKICFLINTLAKRNWKLF